MKSIFGTAFYLRSNYVNKEGKTPVMLRIYLNSERLSVGSTGISVVQSQWDNERERLKGRSTEMLSTNLQLDNISSGLHNIFRKPEMREDLSLERIKSEFQGKKYNGLVYIPTDDKGDKVGTYTNASDIGRGMGYTAVQNKMQKSKQAIKPLKPVIRSKVLQVMRTSPQTEII